MESEPGHRTEEDVPVDEAVARTRATGGVPDADQPDQHSTTGTTPSETFVGRVAGDDPGAAEESGAEARAAARRSARRRAARRRGGGNGGGR